MIRSLFALALALLCFACSPSAGAPAPSPAPSRPELARAVVTTIAEAVKLADAGCSAVAAAARDVATAEACAAAYKVAREALLVAERGVDAWDSGDRKGVVCGVVQGAAALAQMADALRAHDVTLPPLVVDALKLPALLGGVCS